MAIAGDLNDFTMNDILRTVRAKTGTLHLYSALGGRSVEMGLHNNHLLCMFIDGFPVKDKPHAMTVFKQVLNDSHGKFSFQDEPLEGLSRHFLLPVYSLISQTQLEREVLDVELPHPQTHFKTVQSLPAVPGVIQDNWQRALPHLRSGSNAELLAQHLNLTVREAQMMLYRFRSAGLIELGRYAPSPLATTAPTQAQAPLASGTAAPAPAPVQTTVTTETRSILKRLLQRLRGSQAV